MSTPPVAKRGDGAKQMLVASILVGGVVLALAGFGQNDGPSLPMIGGGVAAIALCVVLAVVLFPNGVPDLGGPQPTVQQTELDRATGSWTQAVVIRTYKNDKGGVKKANDEANVLAQHGYHPVGQSGVGSHINVGRTATGAVLTGGISLLFGGSRSKGTIQITYVR